MIDKMIPVSQIMTRDVITLNPLDKMSKVAEIFRTQNIHHLPVVDDHNIVVGIISKVDYYKMLDHFTLFNEAKNEELNEKLLEARLVMDVMNKNVVKLNPDDNISIAVSIFTENLFHALPIVDRTGKLEGIVSTMDLISYAYNDSFPLNEG